MMQPTNDNTGLPTSPRPNLKTIIEPGRRRIVSQFNDRSRVVRETIYQGGQRHSPEGPALRCYDPATGNLLIACYFVHGALHRDDGPAIIHTDRETGIITFEAYYRDGRLHRTNGPAMITHDASTGAVVSQVYAFRNRHMTYAHWQRVVGAGPDNQPQTTFSRGRIPAFPKNSIATRNDQEST